MPHPSRNRAIVSGAGIAGLATAMRLCRDGWRVLIVEKAPARRSSGYLVNLLGTGYDAAERLGILEALAPHDLGAFTSTMVRADGTGKLTLPAALTETALGPRAMTVFRGDLETALYQAIRDEVEIRFATTITAVDHDAHHVEVRLSDGTAETGELLIGADGLHSGVRELVFGPETDHRVDLGHVVAAYPVAVPRLVTPGTSATYIGLGRTAAVVNLGEGRSSAFFAYRCDEPEAALAHGPARALADVYADLGGAFPQVLSELAADPAAAYFDSVSQIDLPTWSRGRTVLLGDAAWCVTLFAGYGAALAMTGADRLGAALAETADVEAALSVWEAGLRPEVVKRQRLARKGTAQYCPPSRAQLWTRDVMLRTIQLPGIRNLLFASLKRASR